MANNTKTMTAMTIRLQMTEIKMIHQVLQPEESTEKYAPKVDPPSKTTFCVLIFLHLLEVDLVMMLTPLRSSEQLLFALFVEIKV